MINEPNVNMVENNSIYRCHHIKRVSWSAIIVGALTGIGLTFLLNLFCVSIGLSVVTTSKDGVTALAIGGFIGLLISVIVAMFVAGLAAGYLGRPFCLKRNLGVVYGFTTWVLALILTVLLAAHMTKYVTYYSSYIYGQPTVVNVVNNDTSPAITANNQGSASAITLNTQKVVNNVGYGSFLVFVIFFVGALSSSIGGHCGMTCKCKDDEIENSHLSITK